MRARPDDATPELLDAVARLVCATPLEDRARLGGTWRQRCLYRSALELLRDLFPDRAIDTSDLELAMIAAGLAGFTPVAPPDGIPEHHWWWRGPARLHRSPLNIRSGEPRCRSPPELFVGRTDPQERTFRCAS